MCVCICKHMCTCADMGKHIHAANMWSGTSAYGGWVLAFGPPTTLTSRTPLLRHRQGRTVPAGAVCGVAHRAMAPGPIGSTTCPLMPGQMNLLGYDLSGPHLEDPSSNVPLICSLLHFPPSPHTSL